MPRNASGVYSKPGGTTAVANTIASSSAYNTLADDLGNEITNSLPRAGTAAPTADLPMGGFKHTGAGDAAAATQYLAAGQAAKGAHEWYGNTSGTNAYTLSATAFAPAALTNGMPAAFRVVNANTGAVTLQVGALAAKAVVRFDNTALASGEWPAGAIVQVRYSSDLDKFVWGGDFGNPALYGKLAANNAWTGNNTHAGTETFNGTVAFNNPVIEDGEALTSSASITPDFSLDNTFTCTLAHNTTINAPSSATAGEKIRIVITQDGSGGRTADWASAYVWPGNVKPVLSTAAGSVDEFEGWVVSASVVQMWPEKIHDYGNQTGAPDIILEEQQAAGTDAGTFTSGAWRTRALNTEIRDVYGLCSLAANQATLQPGRYFVQWSAPAFAVGRHQTRLRNITAGTTTKSGSSEYNEVASDIVTRSHGSVVVTIATATAFEIQHQCQTTKATNGMGTASNFGETEVYARVEIWRLR